MTTIPAICGETTDTAIGLKTCNRPPHEDGLHRDYDETGGTSWQVHPDPVPFDYTTVTCPLCPPSEDSGLYLTFAATYGLSVADLTDPDVPTAAGAHTESWKVECVAGHVILLPGLPGCGCDDPEGPDCSCDQDAFDQSEESSRFRAHDLERLRETLQRLGGAR